MSATILLAVWLRVLTRDDLAALYGALPGAGRAPGPHAARPAGPHAALGASGRT
jgi:hypothetical protein